MIEWKQRMSVGVSQFDEEHKKLVSIINDLHDSMREGKSKEVLCSILDRLVDYTATHFAHEEQLMRQHGYPDMDTHIAEHRQLVEKAKDIQKQARDHVTSALSMQTMSFLSGWLTGHIQGVDARYSAFFNKLGIK